MYYERWTLVALIALSASVAIAMTAAGWRRRRSPLGREFFILAFLSFIYIVGYMGELASDTLPTIRFWLHIESVGIAYLPTAWILFAVRHNGAQYSRWTLYQAFLLMLSTITLILSNTSDFHHLHYGPMQLNPDAPFPVAAFVPGPWYWVHTAFMNLAVLFGNILYAKSWHKASFEKSQQAFVLFLGSLFPWLVYIIYLLKIIPWGIDPLPIAFLVPGLLYIWAAVDLQILEIVPIAWREVFQNLPEGGLVFEQSGRLADFNAACRRIFPCLNDNAIGTDGLELFREYPAMMAMFADATDEQRMMWIETGGEKRNYQLRRIELFDQKGGKIGFMIRLQDDTQFSTLIENLKLQAAIDPLTKSWNRSRWQEDCTVLLQHMRQKQGSISLILADLDNFKMVNDTFGHLAGDTALQEFALTCQANLRAQDIFGRYGGDEFVIILPDITTAATMELAERLRRAVESMTVLPGEENLKVTASFGVIAQQEGISVNLQELIGKADKALYEAKKTGGNRVCRSS
ncbi:MAG: diguanylate cyclase [Negativicutes bacterium]|nr:diguanylate cyclase [Negativicutes bacterium]